MYKLKHKILGHISDARCLSVLNSNEFVSGSRDSSCKIFKRDSQTEHFNEIKAVTFEGKYVNSVLCFGVKDSRKIAVGLASSVVYVYNCLFELLFELVGHSQNISCMSYNDRKNHLITGSWDMSMKIWDMSNGNLVRTITGHENGVWCIKCVEGFKLMLSGSADTTILLWKDYNQVKKFCGHSQSIRDLIILNDKRTFISCGNDMKVIKWDIVSGSLLQVIGEHKSYIYSMTFLTDNKFVSVGEEGQLIVWEDGVNIQEISVPCCSLWSVDHLDSHEFVVTGSDGYLRVYTNDEKFTTSLTDEAIEIKSEKTPSNIPDANDKIANARSLEDDPNIPDISFGLVIPGKTDGQVTLVRNKGQVQVYEWKSSKNQWELFGDMLSNETSVKNSNQSSKVYFEGKEYDYVFDVDLEGMRMAKLPYNRGGDMYKAADEFLIRNALQPTPIYVEQIVNFIQTNVPEQPLSVVVEKKEKLLHKFVSANLEGMFKKISEDLPENSHFLSLSDLLLIKTEVSKILQNPRVDKNQPISYIELNNFPFSAFCGTLDELEPKPILPYLDLLRILSLDYSFASKFIRDDHLIKLWIRFLSDESIFNEMDVVLVLKSVCNMIVILDSNEVCSIINIFLEHPDLLFALKSTQIWSNNRSQIAVATLVFNLSVFLLSVQSDMSSIMRELFDNIAAVVCYVFDDDKVDLNDELILRLLNTIETIVESKKNFPLSLDQKITLRDILKKCMGDKINQTSYENKAIYTLIESLMKLV